MSSIASETSSTRLNQPPKKDVDNEQILNSMLTDVDYQPWDKRTKRTQSNLQNRRNFAPTKGYS